MMDRPMAVGVMSDYEGNQAVQTSDCHTVWSFLRRHSSPEPVSIGTATAKDSRAWTEQSTLRVFIDGHSMPTVVERESGYE